MDDSDPIRQYVRSEHGDVLRTIDACADAVGTDPGETVGPDRDAIVEPFRAALKAAGILSRLPALLADVVDEIGHELPAPPSPAPPYVVVTSTGVLLRVTLPPGRLVIAIEPFDVTRDATSPYRRRASLGLDVRIE